MNERMDGPTWTLLAAVLSLASCAPTAEELTSELPDGGAARGPSQAAPADAADPCRDVSCSLHGACVTTDGVAACECDEGYQAAGLACMAVTPAASGCLAAGSGDYAAEGPYAVTKMAAPLGYTVFYPSTWEPGCLHPIAAWGNGTGVIGTWIYEHLNAHVASWGVVVIASPNPMAGTGLDLAAGLQWLLAQNEDPASPFFGHLSPRAGVAGHSQGGIGASVAAIHPSVVAEVNVEGGLGEPLKPSLATLLLTGTLDFMNPSIQASWILSTGPTFLASWAGADHIITPSVLGALTPGGIQVKRLYAAWYRCFLADDVHACALFTGGESCGLCSEPGWAELRAKNL